LKIVVKLLVLPLHMADFPTHLRTVHFTLVIVCAVTIISLHGVSPGELDQAQEQMRQIRQIKTEWSEWITRWSYDQVHGLEKMGINPVGQVPSAIHVCSEGGRNWDFQLRGSPMRFLISVQGENDQRGFADAVRKVNGDLQFYSLTGPWPNTLKDFKSFWDSAINSQMGVRIVQSIERKVHFLSSDGTDFGAEWTPPCSNQSSGLNLQLRRTDKVCSDWVQQRLEGPLFCADVPNENRIIAVPVKFRDSRIWEGPRFWLVKHYSLPNSATGFAQDFRELNRITALYMDLPIDRVAEILNAEIQRSGERVQMLGLTFSLKVLSQAAAGIIMLVQMYFVLHLKQFSLLASDSDRIAWVAFYSNYSARSLTLVTGVVLPVATCVYATSAHPSYSNEICTFISMVLAAWSGPLLWRLPNQVSPQRSTSTDWPG
jgi:hypothetical protein